MTIHTNATWKKYPFSIIMFIVKAIALALPTGEYGVRLINGPHPRFT